MSYNKEYAQKWRESNREKMREYHLKPVSKFNLTDIEQQRKAFHYTNLQPLWAKENLIKSNNI